MEGSTASYTAKIQDVLGHVLSGQSVVWVSSDATRALVSNSTLGNMLAVNAGSATIRATTSNNKVGAKAVAIKHGAVNSVSLPKSVSVKWLGGKTTVTATLRDAKGHVVPGKVSWKVSGAGNITVASFGSNKATITGGFLGPSQVTATSNGKSAKVAVTVRL